MIVGFDGSSARQAIHSIWQGLGDVGFSSRRNRRWGLGWMLLSRLGLSRRAGAERARVGIFLLKLFLLLYIRGVRWEKREVDQQSAWRQRWERWSPIWRRRACCKSYSEAVAWSKKPGSSRVVSCGGEELREAVRTKWRERDRSSSRSETWRLSDGGRKMV